MQHKKVRKQPLNLGRLETRDLYMSRPGARHVWLARYVRAIGRTCPVKTASAVPETARKMIFNEFWHRANRIYICGTWTSFEKQNIYMA
jgi:hypothetical protein